MHIYIHRDGRQLGPYSVDDAKRSLASGDLRPEDLAWHEGAADWQPLAQVLTFSPEAPPTPVAAPAPAVAPAANRDWIPPRRSTAPASLGVTIVPGYRTEADIVGNALERPNPPASTAVPGNVMGPARKRSRSNAMSSPLRSIGARNMTIGGLICVVGLGVTVFSYLAAAESPGGGTYFVAWGAVVFGGIQFIRGAIQFGKA